MKDKIEQARTILVEAYQDTREKFPVGSQINIKKGKGVSNMTVKSHLEPDEIESLEDVYFVHAEASSGRVFKSDTRKHILANEPADEDLL
jgi:hypothetical protein